MTWAEAGKVVDDIDRAFKVGLLKSIIISVIIFIVLFLFSPILENIYDDFRYWLDCKKYDRENKIK